jgi:hypothetical protein
MRLFAAPAIAAIAAACLLTAAPLTATDQPPVRPVLSGAWSIDKTLSTAPGSVAMPDDDLDGSAEWAAAGAVPAAGCAGAKATWHRDAH